MEQKSGFVMITNPVYVNTATSVQKSKSIPHYLDSYELVYYEHANIRLFYHNHWYSIHDNSVMWIPEYQIHSFEYLEMEKYHRTVIQIKPSFVHEGLAALKLDDLLTENNISQLRIHHLKPEQCRHARALIDLCDEYHAAWIKNPSATSMGLLKSALISLFGLVFTLKQTEMQDSIQLPQIHMKRLTAYIDAHYSENLTLDSLAKELHIDKSYLCRLFRSQTNMTVIHYLHYRRVVEAQKQLMFTKKSIKAVAFECGFNSEQRFYKVFHDISGYTPRYYREKLSQE